MITPKVFVVNLLLEADGWPDDRSDISEIYSCDNSHFSFPAPNGDIKWPTWHTID